MQSSAQISWIAMEAAPAAVEASPVFAKHSVCLVLDYGSQYTQLIARRVRENGVLSMLLPGDVPMVRHTLQGSGRGIWGRALP